MNNVMDPTVLTDITRPYAALGISKRDKSLSFTISIIVHAAIFVSIGAMFVKPPQFAIDHGVGSIEVNLVAAPTETVAPVPVVTPVLIKSDFAEKQIVKPVVVKKVVKQIPTKTKGKDKVTLQSTGGAISEAKPDYLKNPAPEYPELARRRGYQGIVLLTADIDKNGSPVKVEVEKSSGHSILDEAALKAVMAWKFRPGKIGNLPIDSVVRVPVRFFLNEV